MLSFGQLGGFVLRYAFLALAVVFVLVWFAAFIMFHVAGAIVHVLLLGAVILLLVHLFGGRWTT